MRLTVVVPVLNEVEHIEATLLALQDRPDDVEVLVVDGGSCDGTQRMAEPLCDQLLKSAPGRGGQMAIGASAARGDLIWFLHGDTTPLETALPTLLEAATDRRIAWGRFDIQLSGRRRLLRIVERMMNLRSRLTGIATGDQGIFVRRELLQQVGGVPVQPLMEDIELSARLRRIAQPTCLRSRLTTSSRRWEDRGVFRTILLMWWLRLAYAAGVSPDRLQRWYR